MQEIVTKNTGYKSYVHYTCSEQAYQGRLIRLLADTQGKPLGTKYGVGIDEEAGLLVTNVGTVQEKGEVCSILYNIYMYIMSPNSSES